MTRPKLWVTLIAAMLAAMPAVAEQAVTRHDVTEWKSVFGRVEARDTIPARSRIGGTLVSVSVSEGSDVKQGQVIATIYDAKLDLQLQSITAQIGALISQLENAQTELNRGEDLLARGVTTAQRLDALRTQVSVLENQIESTRAQKRVIQQQEAEGDVLAPISGRVIAVPVTSGAVVLPGEAVATIGGGGFFLRLAVPERHAAYLREGLGIHIGDKAVTGRLAKVYPQIENGRVVADVEVADLNSEFVNARVLVRLPVGVRPALLVPSAAVVTRMGLDFVSILDADGAPLRRAVVPGDTHLVEGHEMTEILSGLAEGETLADGHE